MNTALEGRYRVMREIGRGGMATVYLAEDVKHERSVALKVLHPEIGVSLGVERFLAEIRTTANLQHPNILPLYDSGAADKLVFYVMPFIEGETIRERMTREGMLPIGDTVRIVQGAAAALDYAHRHGIIHRDIKPENILLQDKQALVADFGVALAVKNSANARITQTGISVGTPAYMSPEQAAAERNLDGRSDVYSLAAVMYEMLTGEPPFTGKNSAQIMARLMTDVPASVHTRRSSVPEYMSDAIDRALEKVPGDRFSTAAEFSDALERPSTSTYRATVRAARTRGRELAYVGAAILLGIAGWYVGRRFGRGDGADAQPPSRLVLKAVNFAGGGGTFREISLAPSGDELLYAYKSPDGRLIVARQALDAEASSPFTEMRGGLSNMEMAQDGRSFVYSADGHVYRQPMAGGAAEELPIPAFEAIDDGGKVWFHTAAGELAYLGAGNAPVTVAKLPADVLQQFLPDGSALLVGNRTQSLSAGPLRVVDLKGNKTAVTVASDVIGARYTSGYLVYLRQSGALEAQRYDVSARALRGTPVTLASGIAKVTKAAQFSVSRNGTVVYVPQGPRSLVIAGRDGRARTLLEGAGVYHGPRFSPDGRHIAFDLTTNDGRDGWVLDVATGTPSRVTYDRDGHDVIWGPDGRTITYLSSKSGTLGIYRKRADGTTTSDSLYASPKVGAPGPWLKNGSALVSVAENLTASSGLDVGILRNDGKGPFEPILATGFAEAFPALSPDERWLAFASDQSGRQEVYVRPFGHDGDQVQVSSEGGSEPVWSRDGTELFFRTEDRNRAVIAVAAVSTSPAFRIVSRKTLFPIPDVDPVSPHAGFDVSPDGTSFALVRRAPNTGEIMIIQNLPALVQKLQGAAAPPR
ncbi:MAG: protein kinase [Proteobacteria bacterium]|nr:protein kinase [Pseudomonadota bacterium]